MAGDRVSNILEAGQLRRISPYSLVFVIAVAHIGRYISLSTPSGPLPQGMHTSGGFLISTGDHPQHFRQIDSTNYSVTLDALIRANREDIGYGG